MEYGKLILNPKSVSDIPSDFGVDRQYGFDTETYGLKIKDRAFAYQLSDGKYTLYFNLKRYNDAKWVEVVEESIVTTILHKYMSEATHIFIANAKYDMIRLNHIGLEPLHYNIYCNHALHRLVDGNAINCKLSTQGEYWGFPKDDAVEDYIKKHKLWTPVKAFGFDMGRSLHFDQVPFHIMQPYGCRDAWLSYTIGLKQLNRLKNSPLVSNEISLTKVLYNMEKKGIKVDLSYIEKRIEYHIEERRNVLKKLGVGFVDSKTYLEPLFNKHNIPIVRKHKTNEPIFNSDILELHKDKVEEIKYVLSYRQHHTLLKSFYLKLWVNSEDGVIHTDFNQYAAKTGRMSSRNPSLLNIPARSGKEVKRCFVPFKNYQFLCVDHKGAELRLTYDISQQKDMVNRFKKGEDMHQSLADKVNVKRDTAKTVIFALLYGSGIRRIASLINEPYLKAKVIVANIKKGIPNVWKFQKRLQAALKIKGYILNLRGREIRLHRDDDYKILNHYIQGSLADIVKQEMVQTSRILYHTKSFASLTVHDSIIFQIHKDDFGVQTKLVDIMTNNYVSNSGLQLNVDIEHGKYNYGDLENGYCKEIIDEIPS